MEISKQLKHITGSATAEIFAEAKQLQAQGKDIIHLEIGQPDFQPPKPVIEATKQALNEGKTSYTVSRGIPELRKSILNHHNLQSNLDEIIITTGAKMSIFGSLWSVTNPGDNVIILNPSWVSYPDIVKSLGAEPKFVEVDISFKFDEDKLRKNIDERTTAIIVNSPSNPTGAIISQKYLQILYDIVAEHDLLLISDEIYSEYIYEGQHNSLLDINNWQNNGVIVNGFSKSFSMTGFRIGYALANNEIITQINKIMQLTTSCAVNFAQHGALAALDHFDTMQEFINNTMLKRRERTTQLLEPLDIKYHPPKGAIYAWLGIDSKDSVQWSKDLLNSVGVAVTPGRAFGPDGEGYIRLCIASAIDQIETGIERIGEFIN